MTWSPEHRRALQWLLAPALCALIAWTPVLCGDFVYDDCHSVMANPAIRTLANSAAFFADPELFSGIPGYRMYRPVLLLTFAVNYAMGDVAPFVFKLTNVLLHAVTALLLGWLARRFGASVRTAGIAACLFAVHPLCSEAVNLVSARSELLVVLGILLGLHAHRSALQGRRWGPWLAAFAAVLACGSKETGVMLPALMLVQEWLWTGDGQRRLGARWPGVVWRLLPVVAVVSGYLVVRRLLLGQATITLGGTGEDVLFGYGRDLWTQLLTMAVLLPRVLAQMIVPVGLSLDPPVTFHRSLDVSVLSGALALALCTWFGVRRGRQRPLCFLGTALCWATALPWILVPLNVALSEHRLYGPLAGLCLCGAAVAPALGAWPWPRVRVVCAGIGVVFAFLAGRRSLDYADERDLWQPVVAAAPGNAQALLALGLAQKRHGDLDSARASFARAVACNPRHRRARQEWLDALLQLPEEQAVPFLALVVAEAARAWQPDDPYTRIQHAHALMQVGVMTGEDDWFVQAEGVALSCLEVAEQKGLVFRVAAQARRHLRDLDGAIAHLDRSVALGLDHYSVQVDRGLLLVEAGRMAEARQVLTRCLKVAPLDPGVQALLRRCHGSGPGR